MTGSRARVRLAAGAAALMLTALVVPGTIGRPAGGPETVNVQLLAINDFHGNLAPPSGSSGRVSVPGGTVDAGGAEYLATHIASLRAENPNTLVLSAGDLIGASPLLSALFHDEPTIEAMNLIGLDFNAVGNHEFDEGEAELLRMQNGGCHPVDGCLDGDDFAGAEFQFLAANVFRKDNGKNLFPAYKIRTFGGAKVAVVGLVLEGTPTIVTPSGITNLEFRDEADTMNALVPELKAKGVESIVVLIHEGGAQVSPAPYNGCTGISGAIMDIVDRFDDEVDVVLSGHTHQAYNCVIDGKLVTSSSSFGRIVTDVDVSISRSTGEMVSMAANNVIVTRTVAKDGSITALMAKYDAIAAPLRNRIIGSITADIVRANNAAGESPLGNLIADAQLDATNDADNGQAVIAFMNPGGIRTDLVYNQISGTEQPGQVTYGESFNVQPFGNNLVTMTLTGAQIEDMLEQQFVGCGGQTTQRILSVSAGFTYTYVSGAIDCESRVPAALIRLNGQVLDPAGSYRVTTNNFVADGGDGFTTFRLGTSRLGGAVDTDALEQYFQRFSPVAPPATNRIAVAPPA